MTITFLTGPYRKRRGRGRRPQMPPMPPTLLSVDYDVGAGVTLVFDRAIDITGLVGQSIHVDDGPLTGTLYENAPGATLLAPDTVQIPLIDVAGATGGAVLLNATANTGIVSAADNVPWLGVSNYTID